MALIAYSAWVSGIVLIDTTSGLTAPSASSNDVNRAASGDRVGHGPRANPARAESRDFESVDSRVGERMAQTHVAEADDENAFWLGHR